MIKSMLKFDNKKQRWEALKLVTYSSSLKPWWAHQHHQPQKFEIKDEVEAYPNYDRIDK